MKLGPGAPLVVRGPLPLPLERQYQKSPGGRVCYTVAAIEPTTAQPPTIVVSAGQPTNAAYHLASATA
jgi:hypothetical protein